MGKATLLLAGLLCLLQSLFAQSIIKGTVVDARAWNDGSPSTNLGVPVVLTPTRDITESNTVPPRSTVADVYAQVIKDLAEAEAKLPETNGFYATKCSAARVIFSGRYSLMPTFAGAFPVSSSF